MADISKPKKTSDGMSGSEMIQKAKDFFSQSEARGYGPSKTPAAKPAAAASKPPSATPEQTATRLGGINTQMLQGTSRKVKDAGATGQTISDRTSAKTRSTGVVKASNTERPTASYGRTAGKTPTPQAKPTQKSTTMASGKKSTTMASSKKSTTTQRGATQKVGFSSASAPAAPARKDRSLEPGMTENQVRAANKWIRDYRGVADGRSFNERTGRSASDTSSRQGRSGQLSGSGAARSGGPTGSMSGGSYGGRSKK